MAASKSRKEVKQSKNITSRSSVISQDPNEYYSAKASWTFSSYDRKMWSLHSSEVCAIMLDEIIPKLEDFDSKTWATILVTERDKNHSIDVSTLNKIAKDRLEELHIEYASIISLRLTGTHRIYGYIVGTALNILWVDLNHGDNDTCVCRSRKKHT